MGDPKLEMLTAQNSVLLLVDYQPTMFKGVASGDRNAISNSAVAAAKAAKILEVPTVLTSIWLEGNGEFIKEITDLSPGQEVIARKVPGFDAFEVQALVRTILSKTWPSFCVFYTDPAIPWTNNGIEQVIGGMKMRARTVRGYKTWPGMQTGLLLAGTRSD